MAARILQRKWWNETYIGQKQIDSLSSSETLRYRVSDAQSSTTPSDQRPQEEKSAPYQHARYETLLATKKSFTGKYGQSITNKSKRMYQQLRDAQQIGPEDTIFSDHHFEETCEAIRNKNEARVVRDFTFNCSICGTLCYTRESDVSALDWNCQRGLEQFYSTKKASAVTWLLWGSYEKHSPKHDFGSFNHSWANLPTTHSSWPLTIYISPSSPAK